MTHTTASSDDPNEARGGSNTEPFTVTEETAIPPTWSIQKRGLLLTMEMETSPISGRFILEEVGKGVFTKPAGTGAAAAVTAVALVPGHSSHRLCTGLKCDFLT